MSLKTKHITNFQKPDDLTWSYIEGTNFLIESQDKNNNYNPYEFPIVRISFKDINTISYLQKIIKVGDLFTIQGRHNNSTLKKTFKGELLEINNASLTDLGIVIKMDYPNVIGFNGEKYYGEINSNNILNIKLNASNNGFLFEDYYPIKKITFQVKNFSTYQFLGGEDKKTFEPFISCMINNWELPIQFCEPTTIDGGERLRIYKITNLRNFDNEHLDAIDITYETED